MISFKDLIIIILLLLNTRASSRIHIFNVTTNELDVAVSCVLPIVAKLKVGIGVDKKIENPFEIGNEKKR